MYSLFCHVADPSPCGYLPEQKWSLEYEFFLELSAEEYLQRMVNGWRRFGQTLFRPQCSSCQACRPIRVRVADFRPNRSQRRCRKANQDQWELRIGTPKVSREKLDLYDRFHAHQTEVKGWPDHPPKSVDSFADSFVNNPFLAEEWRYYYQGRLSAVGYVDRLDHVGDFAELRGQEGLSAIYFFYDPELKPLAPGTWNVLRLIERAGELGLPFLYLGYWVEGCPSMAYKASFHPHEIRQLDGSWKLSREDSGEPPSTLS
ncbi:MAG: arginyltransferase [Gemmataceae bacterium]